MKYATFSLPNDPTRRLGIVRGDHVMDLKAIAARRSSGPVVESLLELIDAGPEAWKRVAALVGTKSEMSAGHRFGDIHWHAPIPRPRKNIFCLGLNYSSHIQETAAGRGRQAKIPEVPVFFSKVPTTVNGPYDPIPWDRSTTEQVDYEAELGLIIGRAGKNIARAEALGHVFGYTIINDFSARDVQMKHMQWFKGKSLDGFCPMGPLVVTADEFGDPQSKRITLRVNGDIRQSATTADMIFSLDVIIQWLSKGLMLEAGDIISTGTPEGVGLGRTPPTYLNEGDVVETEIEGIGTMRNVIAAEQVQPG